MSERIRSSDWSTHPLGALASWPLSLRTMIRVMLDSRYAMWLGWGRELTFFYNDAYAAMTLGTKHPGALGLPAREVWPEIWGEIGPRAESVLQTGQATWDAGLLLFLERQGFPEETYHTFSYSPVPDDRGGVGGMLCVVTEDTERTIGERRLRTLRELAARTTDGTRSAEEACETAASILAGNPQDVPFALLYLVDKEGRRALLAGASGMNPGTPASPAVVELDRDAAPWPLRQVSQTGRAVDSHHAAWGLGPLTVGAWPAPVHQAVVLPMARPGQTQVAGFIVAGVSPRRPLDDAYRGFFDLLAGQVATAVANARAYEEERTRAEALAELDRAKTAFFSNVSHEFRTPLTLMLGPVEELLARPEGGVAPKEQEALEVIHRSSLRLLKLVNTLLDFSRIEAGRTRASYEPTDVAALTRELVSVFRSAVEKAGLRLVIDCPTLDVPVFLDRDMWEKIVLNLVSNAFKFTFEGEIEVRLRRVGEVVELAVRDTGVGIPAKDLPHVFERFHRVEGAKRRTHEGTGIGLALVSELVKLHAGAARVESVEGRGTTFTVSIPTGSAHSPASLAGAASPSRSTSRAPGLYAEEALRWLPDEQPPEAPEHSLASGPDPSPSPATPRDGRPRARIVLADDNADMRQYVTRLLAGQFDVEAVRDGKAALDAARVNPPDLVLSDVMMPRLDGFGLLRELRADPHLRHVPVILLSARAAEEARIEGIGAGADDYLTKPFSGRELVARVAAHLELARVRREAEIRERELRNEAETLNAVARTLTAELDLETLVQKVTGAGTSLTGAAVGAFFYHAVGERGDALLKHAIAGTHRDAFETWDTCDNVPLFAATLRGEGPVRLDDVLQDPRRGHDPADGSDRLPVRSYLTVPVASRGGEVLGGLFFGHPEAGVFTERAERIALGIAAQAAIAIDNARLYAQAQRELEERKRVQDALRQRTSQYETLLNQAPLGVYLVDADLRIRDVNPTARPVFGDIPDLIGRDLDEVLHRLWPKETAAEVSRAFRHTLETGIPYVAPERSERRADRGVTEYYEWRLDRIPTPDGRWGVVCYFRDISAQVLARLEIARSERRFREIVDALPAAVYTTDGEGRVTHFNPICVELSGRTPELGSDRWCVSWKLYRPDGTPLPHDECPMAVALKEGRIVREEELIVERPDGTRSWITPYPTPLFDDAGHVVGGINMLVDVTARKQAEEQLRRNRDTFFNLVQNSPFGVYLVDSAFRLAQVSLGSQKVFRNVRPLLGRDFAEVLRTIWPESFAREAIARFRHTLDTGEVYHAPDTTQRRGDTADTESYDWKIERVSLPDGQYGVVCYFYDLTALREAQAALHRALDSERRARSDAEQAGRLKDEFLATLSHELRTPLNAILGWSRIVSRNPADVAAVTQGIDVIARNAKVQTDLIADLLDMSRIISGKLRLEVQTLSLSDVVMAAIDAVRHGAEAKGVRIEAIVGTVSDPVRGDASRLQQVVWNLLSNAVKFTPKGGRIQVALAKRSSHAELSVSDTGIGMTPEVLPHVFERFRQGDSSTARRFGGLGLGLAIVKNLVELHGGSVRATSPGAGQGSTFTVDLPLALVHTPLQELASAPAADRISGDDRELSGVRILAVDDQADARDLLRILLEERAAEVVTAGSADEGLLALERHRPHVVLCDIGMPGKDGYEFIRELRRRGDQTPAVAVTAFARSEDRLRALRAGYQGHVSKPVEPAELVATVAVFARSGVHGGERGRPQ